MCTPNRCSGALRCGESCTGDADCIAPSTCVNNSCGKKPLGGMCTAASQCQSGMCTNGVCCEVASCGTCRTCGAAGKCVAVAAGLSDPNGGCQADTSSCVAGGCNGNGGCAVSGLGTICRQTCTNASGGKSTFSRFVCDGSAASCTKPDTTVAADCGEYVCSSATACKTSCASDLECVSGYYCAAGACVVKKGNGAPCAAATECTAGVCTAYYADTDNDRFGAGNAERYCGSAARTGYVTRNGDCCPADQRVHPADPNNGDVAIVRAQPERHACGSFDYDCDGVERNHGDSGTVQQCTVGGLYGFVWRQSVIPACGEMAENCYCDTQTGLLYECYQGRQSCY